MVRDTESVAVNVWWNSDNEKWNLNSNPVGNKWNAGNQIFLRNGAFLSHIAGVFHCKSRILRVLDRNTVICYDI